MCSALVAVVVCRKACSKKFDVLLAEKNQRSFQIHYFFVCFYFCFSKKVKVIKVSKKHIAIIS